MAELDALDDAGDDLAGAVLEFLVDPLFLDPADTRHDGVARHAGSDAAESGRFDFNFQRVTGLNAGFEHLGAGEQHFFLRIAHLVDHENIGHPADLAGLRADLDAELAGVSAETLACRLDNGLLHGLQQGVARNPALALQILQHGQQLVTHGRVWFEDKKKWAETHFSSEKVVL